MAVTTIIATTRDGIARAELSARGKWDVDFPLARVDVRCLASDPLNPDVVYAGTQGEGLLRSGDRGKTWRPAGLEGRIVKSVAAGRFRPGTLYAGLKPAAVAVSRDGGTRWDELEGFRGIPSLDSWWSPAEPPGTAYVQALALSPTDPEVIVAGIEFGAVVRSADGGSTWSDHRETALPDCHTLTFHATDGTRVYEGGSTGAGVALSLDAGESWYQPGEGLDRHYGWAVAADPANPDLVYLSASTSPMSAHGGIDAEAAIFRSVGGAPWEKLGGGLPDPMTAMPYALLTDPKEPGHLYAGFSSGDVYFSADHGESWRRLPFNLKRIRTMVPL